MKEEIVQKGEKYLGREVKYKITFSVRGTFQSYYEACGWCSKNNYEYGSMCGNKPIAMQFERYDLPQKWKNMDNRDKAAADVVMFIHRDWAMGITQDENGNSTDGNADLIVRKWRNGASNLHIPMGFDGPKMKFILNNQQNKWRAIRPETYQSPLPNDKDEDMPF